MMIIIQIVRIHVHCTLTKIICCAACKLLCERIVGKALDRIIMSIIFQIFKLIHTRFVSLVYNSNTQLDSVISASLFMS